MRLQSLFAAALVCCSVLFSCKPVDVTPDDPDSDQPGGLQPFTGDVNIKIDGFFYDWYNVNVPMTGSYKEGYAAIDSLMAYMDADNIYVYLHCADKSKLDNVRICIDNDGQDGTGTKLKDCVCGAGYCGMVNVTNLINPNASVFYKNLAKGDKEAGLTNFITSKYKYDEGTKNALQIELAIDRLKFEEFYPVENNPRIAVYAIDENDQLSASIPAESPIELKYVPVTIPPEPEVYFETWEAPAAPFEYMVSYEYDPSDFPNPERGEYSGRYFEFKNGNMPKLNTPENLGSCLADACSLIHLSVYLQDYRNKELTDEVLQYISAEFQNLRESGCKAILRFAYSYSDEDGDMDAPVDLVVRHIAQLKPVLEEFQDVIFVVQTGFMGIFGEMHSSTYFKTSDDVNRMLRAILDALPVNRQIAVRTNGRKTAFLGTDVADTLTVAEAYTSSDKARIGFYNDCFMATSNDGGTFASKTDRQMWKAESKYLSMGGESCVMNSDVDIYCKCSNAYKDLKDYHWTYLSNHSYIVGVWKDQGCYLDATVRVGYRFVLNGASFSGTFAAGQDWGLKFCFTNYGYASLINERKLEFVVRSVSDPTKEQVYVADVDPRTWYGGCTYVYEDTLKLPDWIVAGEQYKVFINMPDVAPTLHGRPNYSIRFANQNVWEAETGYNLLNTFTAE